jgi:hypothetical protein
MPVECSSSSEFSLLFSLALTFVTILKNNTHDAKTVNVILQFLHIFVTVSDRDLANSETLLTLDRYA